MGFASLPKGIVDLAPDLDRLQCYEAGLKDGRKQALEEAAQIADTKYAGRGWHSAARNAAIGIAEAIRALSEKE